MSNNRFRNSYHLANVSFNTLRSDKSLLRYPVMASIISFIYAAIIIYAPLLIYVHSLHGRSVTYHGHGPLVVLIIFYAIVSFGFLIIRNYYNVGLIKATYTKFCGKGSAYKANLAQSKRQFSSILVFSITDFALSKFKYIPQNNYVRLIDRIANLAWYVASYFALPILAFEEEKIGPVSATVKSANVIKKKWGESVILAIGTGIVSSIIFIAWLTISILLLWATPHGYGLLPVVFLTIFLGTFSSSVKAITKASIYYFAVTSKVADNFDKETLQNAFTVRQAKRIFK